MAQKRMFSLKVIDTDSFTDMAVSAQALYFHLGMHGDDDGFVASPKKIARSIGCSDNDIQVLAKNGFIITFDSGVVVVTDWKINNTLKADRYTETIYLEEKSLLQTEENGRYRLESEVVPNRFQNGSRTEPQYSIEKISVENMSVEEDKEDKRSSVEDKEDKRSLVTGGALTADFRKPAAGIFAPANKQQEEMDFNDLREQQKKRLRDYQM